MIQALAQERRLRDASPAQHGSVAAAMFFLDVSARIAEWPPWKYGRYKRVLWRRSRASRQLGAVQVVSGNPWVRRIDIQIPLFNLSE